MNAMGESKFGTGYLAILCRTIVVPYYIFIGKTRLIARCTEVIADMRVTHIVAFVV
jgi:hypothetical protein